MKREQIKQLFINLARSQGFYGRFLRDIESLDDEAQEAFWTDLENKNFKSEIDLINFVEGV